MNEDFIKQLFRMHKRIAIFGAPGVGKTTFVEKYFPMEPGVVHTDGFMGLGWSESSQAVADALKDEPYYVVEGVTVPRAIRKGLKPDLVVHLKREGFVLNKKHETMYKQMMAIALSLPIKIVEITEEKYA